VTALPRWVRALVGVAIALGVTTALALSWGSWVGFFAHPARLGLVVVMLVGNVATTLSDFGFRTGKRFDADDVWVPLAAGALGALAMCIPPYTDRRDLWVIDGDAVRYAGLALFAIGAVLRVWPMYTLGRRFSAFVAIQEGHTLVTDGVYRYIRHPSYLGGMVAWVGWALVFRSVAGLLLSVPLLYPLVARINTEERLLASEFGDAYAAYRQRTWRLVPGVY
jgi:protein-S-isoprenylcysteine O-methyltransferase Ste14